MLVQECMIRNVEIANPQMNLREVAKKMRDGDFGVMPVGEHDRLVGMITDRDIAIRAVAEGKDPAKTLVGDCMSKQVLYCYEDQTLEDVAKNLGDNQVRRLPVLNRQKRLVGILSLADLALSDADPDQVEAALYHISQKESHRSDVRA
ncbi:MAG: CBS domain-containing protein [Pseudobdellovibrionaceae bacterium]